MLTDDGKHLYVSWDEYHMLHRAPSAQDRRNRLAVRPDPLPARGGMRPGDVLSRVFDKPLGDHVDELVPGRRGTIQGRLDLAKYITMPKGELAGRVLLVDDLADSGTRCAPVGRSGCGGLSPRSPELSRRCSGPRASRRTAPDYHVELLPVVAWIHQPSRSTTILRPRAGQEIQI
jgi:hypothetical protein